MKIISILTISLLISLNLYSQKVGYSFETGGTYTVSSNYGSTGKFGFHLSYKFSFPLNKHFSIKTGLGFNQINNNLRYRKSGMIYFSGITPDTIFYDNRQPFIVPNAVIAITDEKGNELDYDENQLIHTLTDTTNYPTYAEYNLFILNIPLQLQISMLKNKLLLTTGVSASTVIYAKNTIKLLNGESIEYNANDDLRNVFFNLNIGFDFKIYKSIYAGIYYDRSSNISKNSIYLDPELETFGYGADIPATNLNNFSINLIYKF